jgi:hypothetical protein
MRFDVRSNESCYIYINGWVFYVDDSTDEQVMTCWKE